MQTISGQLTEFPDNEQFYLRQHAQQSLPGQQQAAELSHQIYSPQMNQARLLNQQQRLIHGMDGGQDLQATYLLKQKLEAANAAFGHQQQGLQHQQTQPQLLGNNVLSAPPGVSIVQPTVNGLAPPPGTLPPQMPMNANIHTTNVALAPNTPIIHHPNHLLIREVWANNLPSEFASIRRLIDQYNYIALTTEFVGTIVRPIGNFRSKNDYHYQTMRTNIDLLNPLQIGLSISDSRGNKPDASPSTWQFNFHFDITKEMVSPESLELLKKSGIAFDKHQQNGVDFSEFAQLMLDSGLLLNSEVNWISFHAAYDFGFLVNILTDSPMPNNIEDYESWVQTFLPNFYDLNVISKSVQDMKQQRSQQLQQNQQYSLEALADEVGITRFPLFNTTGGQSLLAILTFTRLYNFPSFKLPNGLLDFTKFKNAIYGINRD